MPDSLDGFCETCRFQTLTLHETPCNVCCFSEPDSGEDHWAPKVEDICNANKKQ